MSTFETKRCGCCSMNDPRGVFVTMVRWCDHAKKNRCPHARRLYLGKAPS